MLKNFLAISIAAIVGANLRYLLSRVAARELGPVFPYGTLFINIAAALSSAFPHLDHRARIDRSQLAPAGGDWILRFVHNFLKLCVRDHGLLRAGTVGTDVRQHS